MVSDKEKANAILRIASGASNPMKEALRLKIHPRTVEKWMAKERAEEPRKEEPKPAAQPSPGPTSPAPPPGPGAPGNAGLPGPGAENEELKKVLESAKGGAPPPSKPAASPPAGPPAPTREQAIADGRKKDAAEALKYYKTIKAAAVGAGALAFRAPITDERLEEASEVNFFAEMAIEENAEEVGQFVREKVKGGGLGLVGMVLLLDLAASIWIAYTVARDERRKEAAEKKKSEGKA